MNIESKQINKQIKKILAKVLDQNQNMRWNIEDAKLIIEECMGVVDSCESDLFYDDGMVPIIDVNDRIKKHFGVE
jgi:hypothetical protein